MKFHADSASGQFRITAYGNGYVRVNEEEITVSCIVTPARLIRDWIPQSHTDLRPAHMEPVLRLEPEIVLLGTGPSQHFPAPEVFSEMLQRGIGMEVMSTSAACRTYNILLSEGRDVAAALIVPEI